VLVVVLWRKRLSLIRGDFFCASFTPVYAGPWRGHTRLMDFIEYRVLVFLDELRVLEKCHEENSVIADVYRAVS
jgi:hypothetical protein